MKCKRVELDKLKVGAVLVAPIIDPRDHRLKLLAAGTAVTDNFMDRLRARRVEHVLLSQRDIAMLSAFQPQGRRKTVPPAPKYVQSLRENDGSQDLDHVIESGEVPATLAADDAPIAQELTRTPGTPYADGLKQEWAEEGDARIAAVSDFFEESLGSDDSSVGPLYTTCFELLERLVEDPDALTGLATAPYESDYPSRHGVHLASLAISIAADMGLDRAQLVDLGVGCLMHDIGMHAVGVQIFDTKHELSQGALRRLADHPVRAIEYAMKYGESLSAASRMVLYQLHERCDGSGYPRGRSADEIHPLAKIAAVADAFIGMVSKRKHRFAIQGYHANVALMKEAQNRKFCPKVIRSLLRVTSLHPIGSMVELNNGMVGRVIRSGGEHFVSPTLEVWHPRRLDAQPGIVDLAQEPRLEILASIPAAA